MIQLPIKEDIISAIREMYCQPPEQTKEVSGTLVHGWTYYDPESYEVLDISDLLNFEVARMYFFEFEEQHHV